MIALLSVVTVVCIVYLWYFTAKDIPESLSATYYALGGKGWIFQAVMASAGALLYAVWFPLCGDGNQWMAFLSCASLWFVAADPCFRLELEGKVHYSAAVVCCLCAVAWQVSEGLWDVTLFFLWAGGMLSLAWKDRWCWWMEWAVVGGLLANLWRVA